MSDIGRTVAQEIEKLEAQVKDLTDRLAACDLMAKRRLETIARQRDKLTACYAALDEVLTCFECRGGTTLCTYHKMATQV